jgi:hypothetical protein
MPIPEIDMAGRLRAIYATSLQTRETLTTLHQVDADGREYDLKLEPQTWNVINGRPGLLLFLIPHPLGKKGLWMAAFYVAAGSNYTGSSLNERRIVTVMEGEIDCNGQHYGPGESMSIAPHEATTWRTPSGAAGVTLYEIIEAPATPPPSPAAPEEEPAGCSITPDLT